MLYEVVNEFLPAARRTTPVYVAQLSVDSGTLLVARLPERALTR